MCYNGETKREVFSMSYDFYAFLDRMKYIRRWSLMRSSSRGERDGAQPAGRRVRARARAHRCKKSAAMRRDIEKTVLCALYHECAEVMTGDLPTPIKYYNKDILGAYKELEGRAAEKLLGMLPDVLAEGLAPFVNADTRQLRAQARQGGGQARRVREVPRRAEERQHGVSKRRRRASKRS